LIKLGLKVSPEPNSNGTNSSGTLTPIHVYSASEPLNRAVYQSLMTIADNPPTDDGDDFTITETHDTFHVQTLLSSLYSSHHLGKPLNGRHRMSSTDSTPKQVSFDPLPATFPYFSPTQYFIHLPSSSTVGQSLAYVEVTTSTQTLLDKNPTLLRSLPSGFILVATSQLSGRGRAGNAWISPPGSLAFSFVLRLPLRLSSRLLFVQYLVSLALVEGIRTYAQGWQDVNVSIKWPNDIYGKPNYADRWEKIGGTIVNSTYLENDYILVVGMNSGSI